MNLLTLEKQHFGKILPIFGSCQRVEIYPSILEIMHAIRDYGPIRHFFSKQDYIKMLFSLFMFERKLQTNYSPALSTSFKDNQITMLTPEGIIYSESVEGQQR